jgi:eukaryotic-like serine/threonine-protein kinase
MLALLSYGPDCRSSSLPCLPLNYAHIVKLLLISRCCQFFNGTSVITLGMVQINVTRRRALKTPDPENVTGDETEVEITDLDSPTGTGNLPGRSTRRRLAPSPRERVWMRIAVIAGIVLLVVVVLVSLPHMPEPATVARVTVLPLSAVHPLSLSVDDGIAYASSPDGTVTALRVSDGFRLWRYEGGKVGETSTTVADGAVFLCTLTFDNDAMTVRVDALGASDGSPLWSRTLPVDTPAPIQLAVVTGILYVSSGADSIDTFGARDGSLLWHYTSHRSLASMPSVVDGVVYVSTEDGHVFALRASDAFPLWQSTSLFPSSSASPTVADGIVYLNLQDGSLEALRASNGALLWRNLPPTPLAASSPIVADRVVYVSALDGSVYALRAGDGSMLWRAALHVPNVLPSLLVRDGVMYVESLDGSVYALRANDGSILWRYQDGEGGVATLTVAQGLVYLALQTGNIDALRASDGFVLWRYAPQVPATQLPPLVADDLVLIVLQDGSIDALPISSGTLLWHRAMTS